MVSVAFAAVEILEAEGSFMAAVGLAGSCFLVAEDAVGFLAAMLEGG